MNCVLRLIYFLHDRYHLTLTFWIKLLASFAFALVLGVVLAIGYYTTRGTAVACLLGFGAIAVHTFLRWPGIVTPGLPDMKSSKYGINGDTNGKKSFVRFVAISDSHSKLKEGDTMPPGDVFLHAGDFTLVCS